MSTDRSDKVYEYWLQASQRFDYFVTGVCFALISYLVGTLKPSTIGFNANTLLLLAIICLLGAAVAGLKQIETNVTILLLMHDRLYREEGAGTLVKAASEGRRLVNTKTGDVFSDDDAVRRALALRESVPPIEQSLDKRADRSLRWYKTRNRFLVIGLSGVIISRVIAGYGR